MKNLIFVLALWAPVVGWGQTHGGLQLGLLESGLNGHFTLPGTGAAYMFGAWGEFLPNEWMGIKADFSYTQRKGYTNEASYRRDVLLVSGLMRFHVDDIGSRVRLLAGIGGFVQLPVFSADGTRAVDAGPGIEIGLEYGRFALVILGQTGLSDAISVDPKRQRWVSVGVGVQGRIW